MGKIMIIAEKPSVARDIGRVLKCGQSGNGFIQNDQYIISWAIGHLIVLCDPEDYDAKFKKWDYATLPILPEQIKLKPAKATNSQYRVLKKLMNSQEVDSLICATDSGREGELIFRYIYNYAGCKKPFQRLWISSMTDQAIRDGLSNLRDGHEYDNLYLSAKSRSEADWLVGINATRAYTVQYKTLLSIGRVQTPTLALLVERQKKIDDFKPVEYWEVEAQYQNFSGMWYKAADAVKQDKTDGEKHENEETRIPDRETAKAIADKVRGQTGAVTKKETETKKNPPPLLYDLTELQRDGNKKFGFSAQKTLSIAQDLYEKRKMITYPRTDSRYLSSDYIPKIHSTLNSLDITEYAEFVKTIKELPKLPITKRIVDDSKITDHHAIVPTDIKINLKALSADELKIYDLIARRFLAVFYPAYIYNITKITVEVLGETFLSKGNMIVQLGWMELSTGGKEEKEKPLPNIEKGDAVTVEESRVMQKKTQPPKPYNEATLLSAMENAGRLIENEDLKEQMKDSGLGTPATRAAIIERLIAVGYVDRKAKALTVTDKAKSLIDLVPDALKKPETTGKWEKGLSSIAQGKMSDQKFMTSITNYVQFLVNDSKNKKDVTFKEEERRKTSKPTVREDIGVCPGCGKGNILENTKAFYCGRWKDGCRFTIWKSSLTQYGGVIDSSIVSKLCKGEEIQGLNVTLPQTHEKGTATLVLKGDKSGAVELKGFTRI